MAERFDFWTHGIATILQSPELAELIERRSDKGMCVEHSKDKPSEAWFHIPLTTPTVMEGDTTIYLQRVGLRARVNKWAVVDRIHLRRGADNVPDSNDSVIANWNVSYTDIAILDTFNVTPAQKMGGLPQAGLVMSIYVIFHVNKETRDRGRVEFQGAGAHYS